MDYIKKKKAINEIDIARITNELGRRTACKTIGIIDSESDYDSNDKYYCKITGTPMSIIGVEELLDTSIVATSLKHENVNDKSMCARNEFFVKILWDFSN